MELKELVFAREAARSGEACRIRQEAGISRSELADACGVTESTIQRWETGQSRPSGPRAVAYARMLAELRSALAA